MSKKAKKTKSNKLRRVEIADKQQTSTIDVKLYQLNETLAAPFMRDGVFKFRVAYDKIIDGTFTRFSCKKCPVVSVAPGEVLQTENETAQRMLDDFQVPTNTLRNGVARTAGKLFVDVTKTTNQYDTDLDELFA